MKLPWILGFFFTTITADNLDVAYQWKQLDFEFPSEGARQIAITNEEFIPENNLPLGLEVHDDRVFITVPRWRKGIAASLNYIKLNDPMEEPKLHPYPNWEAHNLSQNNIPEIVSPFRVRADRCNRLWVLDTGEEDILGTAKSLKNTTILIYDLTNNTLIRSYEIPEDQMFKDSFLANIAVEDHKCDDSFAYLGDLGDHPAIVVYSWKNNTSWRVKHHFFSIDPLMTEFNVSGIAFQWKDGVFGLALSKPDSDGFSTLYFHPMSSSYEFAVNTRYLREDVSEKNYHKFQVLGDRGPRGQSGPAFLDQKTDVLFYSLLNMNAVACWRTTNPKYTMHGQGRVIMNNITMVFPNDIKVDNNDTLWVLSDRLPTYMYAKLDQNDINFRIFKAKVRDAIRNTACDSKLVINNTMTITGSNNSDRKKNGVVNFTVMTSLIYMSLVAIFLM